MFRQDVLREKLVSGNENMAVDCSSALSLDFKSEKSTLHYAIEGNSLYTEANDGTQNVDCGWLPVMDQDLIGDNLPSTIRLQTSCDPALVGSNNGIAAWRVVLPSNGTYNVFAKYSAYSVTDDRIPSVVVPSQWFGSGGKSETVNLPTTTTAALGEQYEWYQLQSNLLVTRSEYKQPFLEYRLRASGPLVAIQRLVFTLDTNPAYDLQSNIVFDNVISCHARSKVVVLAQTAETVHTAQYHLEANYAYKFDIVAINSIGASIDSVKYNAPITITNKKAGPPTNVRLAGVDKNERTRGGVIDLEWDAPLDQGDGTIVGYRVYSVHSSSNCNVNYWYGNTNGDGHVFLSKGPGSATYNKCLVLRHSECLMQRGLTPSRVYDAVITPGCVRRPDAVLRKATIGRGGRGLDYNINLQVVVMAVSETTAGIVRRGTAGPVNVNGETITHTVLKIATTKESTIVPDAPIWRTPAVISQDTDEFLLAFDGGLDDGGSNIVKYQYQLCECNTVNKCLATDCDDDSKFTSTNDLPSTDGQVIFKDNIAAAKRYYIRVRAVNAANKNGDWSVPLEEKTEPDAMGIIKLVRSPKYVALESSPKVTFTVTRTAGSSGILKFRYQTFDGQDGTPCECNQAQLRATNYDDGEISDREWFYYYDTGKTSTNNCKKVCRSGAQEFPQKKCVNAEELSVGNWREKPPTGLQKICRIGPFDGVREVATQVACSTQFCSQCKDAVTGANVKDGKYLRRCGARAGTDYKPVAGTAGAQDWVDAEIPSGVKELLVDVDLIDDLDCEYPDEQFGLRLTNATDTSVKENTRVQDWYNGIVRKCKYGSTWHTKDCLSNTDCVSVSKCTQGGTGMVNTLGCTKNQNCDGDGTCLGHTKSCTTNSNCNGYGQCLGYTSRTCTNNAQCNGYGSQKCSFTCSSVGSGICQVHSCKKTPDDNEYGPTALFTIADAGFGGSGSDAGVLEFASTTMTVGENVGQVLVTVTRRGGVSGPVRALWWMEGGDGLEINHIVSKAEEGTSDDGTGDYFAVAGNGVLEYPHGGYTKRVVSLPHQRNFARIELEIVNDDVFKMNEITETFKLRLMLHPDDQDVNGDRDKELCHWYDVHEAGSKCFGYSNRQGYSWDTSLDKSGRYRQCVPSVTASKDELIITIEDDGDENEPSRGDRTQLNSFSFLSDKSIISDQKTTGGSIMLDLKHKVPTAMSSIVDQSVWDGGHQQDITGFSLERCDALFDTKVCEEPWLRAKHKISCGETNPCPSYVLATETVEDVCVDIRTEMDAAKCFRCYLHDGDSSLCSQKCKWTGSTCQMRGYGATKPTDGAVFPQPTASHDYICSKQPDVTCDRNEDCKNACPCYHQGNSCWCRSDTCIAPPFAAVPLPLGVCVKETGGNEGRTAEQHSTPCTSDIHCQLNGNGFNICYRPYKCSSHSTQATCMLESFGCSYDGDNNRCNGGWFSVTPDHNIPGAQVDTFTESTRKQAKYSIFERNENNVITKAAVNQYSEYTFDPLTKAATFKMVGLVKQTRYLFRMSPYNYYGSCAKWTNQNTCNERGECTWSSTECVHNDRIDSVCKNRMTKAHCLVKGECRWTLNKACVLSGHGKWSLPTSHTTDTASGPLSGKQPTSIAVTGGVIVVKWSAPGDSGGIPIDSYELMIRDEATGFTNVYTENQKYTSIERANRLLVQYKTPNSDVFTMSEELSSKTTFNMNDFNSPNYALIGSVRYSINANTKYILSVRANNAEQSGELSQHLTVTTSSAHAPSPPLGYIGDEIEENIGPYPINCPAIRCRVDDGDGIFSKLNIQYENCDGDVSIVDDINVKPSCKGYQTVCVDTSMSGGSLLLQWRKPFDTGGSTILKYYLQYQEKNNQDSQGNNGKLTCSWVDVPRYVPAVTEFFQHKGLREQTIYTYRIAASNSVTENDKSLLRWSTPISYRTGSETPSEPPINIQEISSLKTGGAIAVKWDPPHDCGGGLLEDLEYTVKISLHNTNSPNQPTIKQTVYQCNNTKATTCTIYGWWKEVENVDRLDIQRLKFNTKYNIHVQAINTVGRCNPDTVELYSETKEPTVLRTHTSATEPGAPLSIFLCEECKTGGKLDLQWSEPLDFGGTYNQLGEVVMKRYHVYMLAGKNNHRSTGACKETPKLCSPEDIEPITSLPFGCDETGNDCTYTVDQVNTITDTDIPRLIKGNIVGKTTKDGGIFHEINKGDTPLKTRTLKYSLYSVRIAQPSVASMCVANSAIITSGDPAFRMISPTKYQKLTGKAYVRCCKDNKDDTFEDRVAHKYFKDGKKRCYGTKTYAQAEQICAINPAVSTTISYKNSGCTGGSSEGCANDICTYVNGCSFDKKLRLCTMEEVLGGRTTLNECNRDTKHIWTNQKDCTQFYKLTKNSNYYINVFAENTVGYSKTGTPLLQPDGVTTIAMRTTDATLPGQPNPPKSAPGYEASGKLYLTWDYPNDEGGEPVESFEVFLTYSGSANEEENEQLQVNPRSIYAGRSLKSYIGGLKEDTLYSFRVVAKRGKESGPFSEVSANSGTVSRIFPNPEDATKLKYTKATQVPSLIDAAYTTPKIEGLDSRTGGALTVAWGLAGLEKGYCTHQALDCSSKVYRVPKGIEDPSILSLYSSGMRECPGSFGSERGNWQKNWDMMLACDQKCLDEHVEDEVEKASCRSKCGDEPNSAFCAAPDYGLQKRWNSVEDRRHCLRWNTCEWNPTKYNCVASNSCCCAFGNSYVDMGGSELLKYEIIFIDLEKHGGYQKWKKLNNNNKLKTYEIIDTRVGIAPTVPVTFTKYRLQAETEYGFLVKVYTKHPKDNKNVIVGAKIAKDATGCTGGSSNGCENSICTNLDGCSIRGNLDTGTLSSIYRITTDLISTPISPGPPQRNYSEGGSLKLQFEPPLDTGGRNIDHYELMIYRIPRQEEPIGCTTDCISPSVSIFDNSIANTGWINVVVTGDDAWEELRDPTSLLAYQGPQAVDVVRARDDNTKQCRDGEQCSSGVTISNLEAGMNYKFKVKAVTGKRIYSLVTSGYCTDVPNRYPITTLHNDDYGADPTCVKAAYELSGGQKGPDNPLLSTRYHVRLGNAAPSVRDISTTNYRIRSGSMRYDRCVKNESPSSSNGNQRLGCMLACGGFGVMSASEENALTFHEDAEAPTVESMASFLEKGDSSDGQLMECKDNQPITKDLCNDACKTFSETHSVDLNKCHEGCASYDYLYGKGCYMLDANVYSQPETKQRCKDKCAEANDIDPQCIARCEANQYTDNFYEFSKDVMEEYERLFVIDAHGSLDMKCSSINQCLCVIDDRMESLHSDLSSSISTTKPTPAVWCEGVCENVLRPKTATVSTADVEWNEPKLKGGVPVDGYRIEYTLRNSSRLELCESGCNNDIKCTDTCADTTEIKDWQSANTQQKEDRTGNTRYIIRGLAEETEYYVRVYALNKAGSSNPTQRIIVKTGANVAPPDIPKIGCLSSNSVSISWTDPPEVKTSVFVGFRLYLSKCVTNVEGYSNKEEEFISLMKTSPIAPQEATGRWRNEQDCDNQAKCVNTCTENLSRDKLTDTLNYDAVNDFVNYCPKRVARCMSEEVDYYTKDSTGVRSKTWETKRVRAWKQSYIGSERPIVDAAGNEISYELNDVNRFNLYSYAQPFEIIPPAYELTTDGENKNCHISCQCVESVDCSMSSAPFREKGEGDDYFFKRYTAEQRHGLDKYSQLIDGLEPGTTYELRVSAVNATIKETTESHLVGDGGTWNIKKNDRKDTKLEVTKRGTSNGPISYPLIFTTPSIDIINDDWDLSTQPTQTVVCRHGTEELHKTYQSTDNMRILKSRRPYQSNQHVVWKLFPERELFTLSTRGVALASITINFELFDVECDHDSVEIRYGHSPFQLIWKGGCRRKAFAIVVPNAVRIDPTKVPRPGIIVKLLTDDNTEHDGIRFKYQTTEYSQESSTGDPTYEALSKATLQNIKPPISCSISKTGTSYTEDKGEQAGTDDQLHGSCVCKLGWMGEDCTSRDICRTSSSEVDAATTSAVVKRHPSCPPEGSSALTELIGVKMVNSRARDHQGNGIGYYRAASKAYQSIARAISGALNGDIILIAPGIYKATSKTNPTDILSKNCGLKIPHDKSLTFESLWWHTQEFMEDWYIYDEQVVLLNGGELGTDTVEGHTTIDCNNEAYGWTFDGNAAQRMQSHNNNLHAQQYKIRGLTFKNAVRSHHRLLSNARQYGGQQYQTYFLDVLSTTGSFGTTNTLNTDPSYQALSSFQIPRAMNQQLATTSTDGYLWDMPDTLKNGVLIHISRSKPIPREVTRTQSDMNSMRWHEDDDHKGLSARESCSKKGQRLCYRHEICPGGRNSQPYGGSRKDEDGRDSQIWAPVNDAPYHWVCIGSLCNAANQAEMCALNSEIDSIGRVSNNPSPRDIGMQELLCCDHDYDDENDVKGMKNDDIIKFRLLSNTVLYLSVDPIYEDVFNEKLKQNPKWKWKPTGLETNNTHANTCQWYAKNIERLAAALNSGWSGSETFELDTGPIPGSFICPDEYNGKAHDLREYIYDATTHQYTATTSTDPAAQLSQRHIFNVSHQYAPKLYRWETVLTPKASDEYYEIVLPRPGAIGLFASCPDDNIGGGCIRGGALSVHNNVDLTLEDTVLEHNKGEVGGALVVEDGRLSMRHSIVRHNTVQSNGGGLYVSSRHSKVKTEIALSLGSQINFNIAMKDGGGIAVRGGVLLSTPLILSGTNKEIDILSNNIAKHSGGNIATVGKAVLQIKSLSLLQGEASTKDGGGAYLSFGTNAHLQSTILQHNSAKQGRGGGVALDSIASISTELKSTGVLRSTLIMDGTIISHNQAREGGGISGYGQSNICGTRCSSDTELKTSKITMNRALKGAGIFVKQDDYLKKTSTGDTTLLRNMQIEYNCASNDTEILDGTKECGEENAPPIKGGYRGQGGGLYCMGGQCQLTSSLLRHNRAEKRGGGITVALRALLSLATSQVIDNLAGNGGGIATDDFYGPCEVSDQGVAQGKEYSKVDSNTAIECGGNIEIQGSLQPVYVKGYGTDAASCESANLKGMVISNGRAKNGAGICVPDCGARFEFLKIHHNHADYNGGGIYHTGHVVKMLSVEFKQNSADLRGGGIYMEGKNSHVLGNPRFIGNTARVAGGGAAIMSARGIDRWFPLKNGGLSFKEFCRKRCEQDYDVNAKAPTGVDDFTEIMEIDRYKKLGCIYYPKEKTKSERPECVFNDRLSVKCTLEIVYDQDGAPVLSNGEPVKEARPYGCGYEVQHKRVKKPSGTTEIQEAWEFLGADLHEPSNLLFEMNMALRGGAVYVAGGNPSVSYANIWYNAAGRRTESAGSVLIENGRGGAVYADKINDQQSIKCQTAKDQYDSVTPYYFRIVFRNKNWQAENDYIDIDAATTAQEIRHELIKLKEIDDVDVQLTPAGRMTACSKAGDTRIVVTFNHTKQGGDLPLLQLIRPNSGKTPETPENGGDLTVVKNQAGYGAPRMLLIDSDMVGNVALGEFGRGGGMYANDGVVRHKNSKVVNNKAASGGGLYMGKSGLFELIELSDCVTEGEPNDDNKPLCSKELLIQSNEACRVDQGYDSCAIQKATPSRSNPTPQCPSTLCPTKVDALSCDGTLHCDWNDALKRCKTLIQTPMNFGNWGDEKACAARVSGRGLFRGGNINVEGDVTLDGMSITYGRAEVGGAVYINVNSVSTLSRCAVQYNRAMDKGGGIYFGYNADVKLIDMFISENHAKLGGGMFLDRCSGEHMYLNITLNSASEAGGGMYSFEGTTFLGSNSTLSANSIRKEEDETDVVPIGGAGVYVNGKGFHLEGFSVIDSVSEKGGGIFVESESKGLFRSMRIANNRATQSQGGGGLYISADSDIEITDTLIEKNNGAEGGAMSIDSAKVDMMRVTFFNNTAQGNGGAIMIKGEHAIVSVLHSTFDSNTALSGDGGGLALTDSKRPKDPPVCNVQSSVFRDNEALGGNGGNAMVDKSMTLNIMDSVISCRTLWKNGDGEVMLGSLAPSAINGGGLYYGSGTNGTIMGVSVRGCKAEAGGGLYVVESELVTIGTSPRSTKKSTFQYNIADFGGAVAVSLKASLTLQDMLIMDNRANYDGAGVHVEDTYVEMNGVLILRNNADSRGGGVYVDKKGELIGRSVTLMENYAEGEGGGMYMGWGSHSVLQGCRFGSNIARASGGAIYTTSREGLFLVGTDIVIPQRIPPVLPITDCVVVDGSSKNRLSCFCGESISEKTSDRHLCDSNNYCWIKYEENTPTLEDVNSPFCFEAKKESRRRLTAATATAVKESEDEEHDTESTESTESLSSSIASMRFLSEFTETHSKEGRWFLSEEKSSLLLQDRVSTFQLEGNKSYDVNPVSISSSFETSYMASWKNLRNSESYVFVEINSGRCDDVQDRIDVWNQTICLRAAEEMGWNGVNRGAQSNWQNNMEPAPGCFKLSSDGDVIFNDPNVTEYYNNMETAQYRQKQNMFVPVKYNYILAQDLPKHLVTPDSFDAPGAWRGAECSETVTCMCVLDHIDDRLYINPKKSGMNQETGVYETQPHWLRHDGSTGTHDQQLVSDCMFWNNSVEDSQSETTGGGGAVSVAVGGLAIIHSCDFHHNRADKGVGGAFSIDGNSANISMYNTTLRYNSAIRGGGVYMGKASVGRFERTNSWGNNATDEGGAFHLDGPSTLHYHFGNVIDNHAGTDGGGGYLGGTRSSLSSKGTAYVRNTATSGYGGALCATHTKKPKMHGNVNLTTYTGEFERCFEVEASLFSYNVAGQGGSIYWTFTDFQEISKFTCGGDQNPLGKDTMCTLRDNYPGGSDGLATNTVYTTLKSWIPAETIKTVVDMAAGATGGVNADGQYLDTATTRSGVKLAHISRDGAPKIYAQDYYHQRSTLDFTTQCDLHTLVLNQLTDAQKIGFPLVRENAIVDNGVEITAQRGEIAFNDAVIRGDIGASYYFAFHCTAGLSEIPVNGKL
jgi:hypothetical protein